MIFCILIGFVAALGGGYFIIPVLRRLKAGQHIREDGPESHKKKGGTPTMGGLIFMFGALVACVIMAGKVSFYLVYAMIGAFAFGIIGLIDDMIIVLKHRSEGLKPNQKMIILVIFAALVTVYAYLDDNIGSSIYIPIANIYWDMGFWYIPFNIFFILALTNSVNLTDGLDGLAGSVSLMDMLTYAVILLLMTGTAVWKTDMIVFAAAIAGALLGFLRFNAHPAKVFMGDTGAFFLGGALCMLAIITKTQIIIPFIGIMFLLSSLSCIIQVAYYKKTKKRVFRMAPLHHHFELGGTHETKIVSMYTIVTALVCLVVIWCMSL